MQGWPSPFPPHVKAVSRKHHARPDRQPRRRSLITLAPDKWVTLRDAFGVDSDMKVPFFSHKDSHVPEIDSACRFDPQTTKAICAGFANDRRVMVQGYHGTGKSTHIEQIAARLNWPLVRVNLDSHVSRIDLVGKDAIVLKDGKQVTEFREGILPWALQRLIALVFDEYDAGRPDVMFVIQRVLEAGGKLTLLDQNRVIRANPYFRLFSTTNTIGLGDTTGLYHGTQQINQGQMDRWSIVTTLNYLDHDVEAGIVLAKNPSYDTPEGKRTLAAMVRVADMTRNAFMNGDISTVDEPAHGDHLGPERRDLRQGHRPGLPPDLPEQVRRAGAADRRRVLPARVRDGSAGERGAGEGGLMKLALALVLAASTGLALGVGAMPTVVRFWTRRCNRSARSSRRTMTA